MIKREYGYLGQEESYFLRADCHYCSWSISKDIPVHMLHTVERQMQSMLDRHVESEHLDEEDA
jgi:hypothetical protein